LNYISNIFVWSSKKSVESPTERLLCDICGKNQSVDGMYSVVGGICVCNHCVQAIVIFYVLHSPIKTLCPHCYDTENTFERCSYCDLQIQVNDDTSEESVK
jgi:hypothetical protein